MMTTGHASMYRYSDADVAEICHAAVARLEEIQDRHQHGLEAPDGIATDNVRQLRSGVTLRELHEQNVREMTAGGWTRGPFSFPEHTSPDLVPYSDLPSGRRDRDRLFTAIVTVLTDVAS